MFSTTSRVCIVVAISLVAAGCDSTAPTESVDKGFPLAVMMDMAEDGFEAPRYHALEDVPAWPLAAVHQIVSNVAWNGSEVTGQAMALWFGNRVGMTRVMTISGNNFPQVIDKYGIFWPVATPGWFQPNSIQYATGASCGNPRI